MGVIGLIQLLIDLPALIMLARLFGKDHRTGKRTVFAFFAHTLGLVGLILFTVALLKSLAFINILITLALIGLAIFAVVMVVWIMGIILVRR